jgi:MerR family copper efflux transcriptional regulator
MASEMLIGELAKQAGLTVKTVRYYEAFGLLPAAQRRESGYRTYSPADLDRVAFIKGAKALGLTLAQIKEIIAVWDGGQRPCGRVAALIDEKLARLDQRIAELTAFRDALSTYKADVEAQVGDEGQPCVHIGGVIAGRWHGGELPAELA